MFRAQFCLNLAGFFAHLPDLRVVCEIAIRRRVCNSDCDFRAQRGRVAADRPEQILFVDDCLPHFVFVQFPRAFPFKGFLLSLQHNLHYI